MNTLHYIGALFVVAIGVCIIQHSLDSNFFVQWGLSFVGLMLILVGNDWRNKLWAKDHV
jgi:hypothetical protein